MVSTVTRSQQQNKDKPFNSLFCIVVLPPDDCNLIPDVTQFLSHIVVGIEQSLSSLVNEVNIPDARQSYTTPTSNNDLIRPVKIFDHCL